MGVNKRLEILYGIILTISIIWLIIIYTLGVYVIWGLVSSNGMEFFLRMLSLNSFQREGVEPLPILENRHRSNFLFGLNVNDFVSTKIQENIFFCLKIFAIVTFLAFSCASSFLRVDHPVRIYVELQARNFLRLIYGFILFFLVAYFTLNNFSKIF